MARRTAASLLLARLGLAAPGTVQSPRDARIEADLTLMAGRLDADLVQRIASSPLPVDLLADTAYELATEAGERLGSVDEDVAHLAAVALGAVATVVVAAGGRVDATVIAAAMQRMALRFYGELGVSTQGIRSRIIAIDPAEAGKALERWKSKTSPATAPEQAENLQEQGHCRS